MAAAPDPSAVYIDRRTLRSCILRAWNNYHGFAKYEEPAANHENTLDYFYTLTPPHYRTLTIPSSYFHIATLYKWPELLECPALFVVNGTHVYCVKKTTDWRRYDWPICEIYAAGLREIDQHSLYIIFLYPAANHTKLTEAVATWQPKNTRYYTEFRRKLLEALRAAT